MKQTRKKRPYERPTTQIVELRNQCCLLQASIQNYEEEAFSREFDGLINEMN